MSKSKAKQPVFHVDAETAAYKLRSAIIDHSKFIIARDAIENLYWKTEKFGDTGSISLVAPSRGGKSTLIDSLKVDYGPQEKDDRVERPILFVEIPAGPTIQSVARAMIHALGGNSPLRSSSGVLTDTLVRLIRECRSKVAIVDEVQHFLEKGSKIKSMEIADWFKGLMNRAKISIVFAGLPYIDRLFHANSQLRSRFGETYRLDGWDVEVEDQKKEFCRVIKNLILASEIEINCEVFNSGSVLRQLQYATNGLVGHLTHLLEKVIRDAVIHNKEAIELSDLENAFRAKIWPDVLETRNPFGNKFNGLALTGSCEPFAEEA